MRRLNSRTCFAACVHVMRNNIFGFFETAVKRDRIDTFFCRLAECRAVGCVIFIGQYCTSLAGTGTEPDMIGLLDLT